MDYSNLYKTDEEKIKRKVKNFEIEMLNDRGYPIDQIHFDYYYERMKRFDWLIRLKFLSTEQDIIRTQNDLLQNFIIRLDNVIVYSKGIIIFLKQSQEEIIKTNIITQFDNEKNKNLTGIKYTKESKYRLNTGIFSDLLVMYNDFEGIDKSKISTFYGNINTFLDFLVSVKGQKSVSFDQQKTKDLNLLNIVSDSLNNYETLCEDIKNLFNNIEFFKYSELKFNPSKHVLVPRHQNMNKNEIINLINGLKIEPTNISKSLPLLRKDDRISRHYLFVKGNLIKIKRPSLCFPNEYIDYYRYVI